MQAVIVGFGITSKHSCVSENVWGVSVSCRSVWDAGFPIPSALPPHTGHQLVFTRERKDSIEMIKLINRSDLFFTPRFSFKNVFFFLNFNFPQGSPKMAELIRIPWLCGLSAPPEGPRSGGSGLGGGRVPAQERLFWSRGSLRWTAWGVPALGSPSWGRDRRAGPLLGPPPCAGQVAAR